METAHLHYLSSLIAEYLDEVCMSCLAMDRNKNVDSFPKTSLVLLTFLQHKSCHLNENLRWNTNHNCIESDDELQTDGHSFDYRDLLQDLQHQVQPRLPGIIWINCWAPFLQPSQC